MLRAGSSFFGTDGHCVESSMAPMEHIRGLPSKSIREAMATALNVEFLHLPRHFVDAVVSVIARLHNASLLIDDIEDSATMRRGVPCAHRVFGVPMTINSANQAYFEAMQEALDLPSRLCEGAGLLLRESGEAETKCSSSTSSHGAAAHQDYLKEHGASIQLEITRVFTQEMIAAHAGQGLDIMWRDTLTCPTLAEYEAMAIRKTGVLFRLLVRMMIAIAFPRPSADRAALLVRLMEEIGLLFQILDDFLNVQAPKYHREKMFFEDLTEGKFSFPIIHHVRAASVREPQPDRRVFHVLRQRTTDVELKQMCVKLMAETGTFDFCRAEIARHRQKIEVTIAQLGGSGTALLSFVDGMLALAAEES